MLYSEFVKRNTAIFGVSLLSEEWIADFANRNALPYLLLSDHEGEFSNALALPRFKAGETEFLHRLTLICDSARITDVIYPIAEPEQNVRETLNRLARS